MLFPNEGWESGDAGGWTFAGTVPPLVNDVYPRTGIYSLRWANYSTTFYGGSATYTIDDPAEVDALRFKTVTFRVWHWGEASNNQVKQIIIDDGVGSTTVDLTHDGDWYLNEVARVITAMATRVMFKISFSRGGTGPVGRQYIDDMESDPVILPPLLDTDAIAKALTEVNPAYFAGSGGGRRPLTLIEENPSYEVSGDIIYAGKMVGLPPGFPEILLD